MTLNKSLKEYVSSDSSPVLSLAKLSILVAGGYLLWTNRFKVQKFLEAQGISTPWLNGNLGEAIFSGAAKMSGAVEHEAKTYTQPNSISNIGRDTQKPYN